MSKNIPPQIQALKTLINTPEEFESFKLWYSEHLTNELGTSLGKFKLQEKAAIFLGYENHNKLVGHLKSSTKASKNNFAQFLRGYVDSKSFLAQQIKDIYQNQLTETHSLDPRSRKIINGNCRSLFLISQTAAVRAADDLIGNPSAGRKLLQEFTETELSSEDVDDLINRLPVEFPSTPKGLIDFTLYAGQLKLKAEVGGAKIFTSRSADYVHTQKEGNLWSISVIPFEGSLGEEVALAISEQIRNTWVDMDSRGHYKASEVMDACLEASIDIGKVSELTIEYSSTYRGKLTAR